MFEHILKHVQVRFGLHKVFARSHTTAHGQPDLLAC